MIKAIFFDFDGVIVDSELLHSQATIDFLKSEKISIPDKVVYTLIGGNKKMNNWRKIYDQYKSIIPYDYDTFRKKHVEYRSYLKEYDYSKIMFEDVKQVLSSLKSDGYKIALASSSPMEYLDKNLKACRIYHNFDYIISGEDLKESKPNPEIYTKCLDYFRFNSSECIVIEDSTYGIQAAKSAGCKVIAIKDTRFGMKQNHADYYADNLTEALKIIRKLD